jgi:tetratricopeptide (TPR) repeat protein
MMDNKAPSDDKETSEKDSCSAEKSDEAEKPCTHVGKSSNNDDESPSMSLAFFFYWVVPVIILAIVSRHGVNTDIGTIPVKPNKISLQRNHQRYAEGAHRQAAASVKPAPSPVKTSPPKPTTASPTQSSTSTASTYTIAYTKVLKDIEKRKRRWDHEHYRQKSETTAGETQAVNQKGKSAALQNPPRGASSDPARMRFLEQVQQLRTAYQNQPTELLTAIAFADALRYYDVQYRDGGSLQQEGMQVYQKAVDMAVEQRQAMIDAGQETNIDSKGQTNVNSEVVLPYHEKSADGILCGVLSSQGKLFFMANMFEKSVQSYTHCLEVAPLYMDALNSRGSSLLILGKYKEAAADFIKVIRYDQRRLFTDSFTGLARILEANEDVMENGWHIMVSVLNAIMPQTEKQLQEYPQAKQVLSTSLSRYHYALFAYHDKKTKDTEQAWQHLTQAHSYKLSILPPWQAGSEYTKTRQTTQIFHEGFWVAGMGSQTQTPIFIIGFPRSGSTLLERVLDAHPLIVGTGENSVFNGRLDDIRNQIVKASVADDAATMVNDVSRTLADSVVVDMKKRWEELERAKKEDEDNQADTIHNINDKSNNDGKERKDPQRFVDKMLTNYNNVGFIHMLYPNALILHVYREPMDTLYSAYKHEFPSGNLDYTTKFESLAELYGTYREMIEHWDNVLPGRITHVRYEDMVHDMPGMARAIIDSTGLPWDESVIDFHKKKHAVNTLSTTQVRKGVYKDSLQSWKRYEEKLQPLVKLIGKHVEFDIPHSLKSIQMDQEL